MIVKKTFIIWYIVIALALSSLIYTVSAEQKYATPFGLCAGTTRYNGIIEQAPYVCDSNGKPVRTLGIGTSQPSAGFTLSQNDLDTNTNYAVVRHLDKSFCLFVMANRTNFTNPANTKMTLCEMGGQLQINMYNGSIVSPAVTITPQGEIVSYKPVYSISSQGHWGIAKGSESDGLMHFIPQEPHWSLCKKNC